jgi:chitin binding peritrophin-A-like protein with CBM14 domain
MSDRADSDPPECGENESFHPNRSKPGTFWVCKDGVPHLQPCPAGMIFNPETQTCDWPAAVKPYWPDDVEV